MYIINKSIALAAVIRSFIVKIESFIAVGGGSFLLSAVLGIAFWKALVIVCLTLACRPALQRGWTVNRRV